MDQEKVIEIRARLVHQTEPAILIGLNEGGKELKIWLPKKEIEIVYDPPHVVVTVPIWLAKLKEIENYGE